MEKHEVTLPDLIAIILVLGGAAVGLFAVSMEVIYYTATWAWVMLASAVTSLVGVAWIVWRTTNIQKKYLPKG